VELCLSDPQKLEEAFEYIELAKSRTLMDRLMQPVHVPSEADAGQSDLVRSIRNLREELNWYYNRIEREQLKPEERSPERIEELERQARSHEDDLMRALHEATLDEANQAGFQMPSAVSLKKLQSLLPVDTVLVEYFLPFRIAISLACSATTNCRFDPLRWKQGLRKYFSYFNSNSPNSGSIPNT
jgi:hypothetical protein